MMNGQGVGDGGGDGAAFYYSNAQEAQRVKAMPIGGEAVAGAHGGVVPSDPTVVQGVIVKRDAPEWKGHFCNCCCEGACDSAQWACPVTAFFPCITAGANHYRLYGSVIGAIIWTVLSFGLFVFWGYFGFLIILELIAKSCDPDCTITIRTELYGVFIGLVVWWIGGIIYSTYLRNKMRTKFNIHGSNFGCGDGNAFEDCVAWAFCEKCIACQEARTLSYNNIQGGVWNGPDLMVGPHPNFNIPLVRKNDIEVGNATL